MLSHDNTRVMITRSGRKDMHWRILESNFQHAYANISCEQETVICNGVYCTHVENLYEKLNRIFKADHGKII